MLQSVRLIFTARNWNPVSSMIRYALPRSILRPALSSHCLIDMGDGTLIEANMIHKVRHVDNAIALAGARIVATREYLVPFRDEGRAWLLAQVGKRYDFPGAFGLVEPDRQWQSDDAWFCYELAAAFLMKCGLNIFNDRGHMTERELLNINTNIALALQMAANPLTIQGP